MVEHLDDMLPPDAKLLERNGSVLLVQMTSRKIQPFVVYDRGYNNGVYHRRRDTANLCLAREKACGDCIAVVEDCRNKEPNPF